MEGGKRWPWSPCRRSVFETLLLPHVPHLYRLAYRFCGNRDDAEDLVQDLLAKLYPRAAELTELDRPRPWLSRVLYRMYVDGYRRAARDPVELSDQADTHPTSLPGPEQAADRAGLQRRIGAALERLNDDQRAVVILHDMEGFSLPEVQLILDVPLGTLKSRLNRAHARLRSALYEPAEEPIPAPRRVIE